jgi:histidinol-phosphate aminotransferase
MSTNRREWLRQTGFAAMGLGLSLRSLANEEGLPRNFGMNKGLVNLGSNENPYGISPAAKHAINEMMGFANRYQYNVTLLQPFKKQLADHFKVAPDQVLITAGSGEGLNLLGRYYSTRGNIVTATPTFGILPSTVKRVGGEVIEVPLTEDKVHDLPALLKAINSKTSLVYIVNPANPTATMLKPAVLKSFCTEASKSATVLIDEAYIDFLDTPDNESMISLIANNPKILVISTFSKIHAMAGLRVGYVIGNASVIRELDQAIFSNTINCVSNLSQAAAMASLKDMDHTKTSKEKNALAREYTYNELKKLKYKCFPSYTNFLFFNLGNYAGDFAQDMLAHNIVLRSTAYPDGKWCRVSIGTMDEMKLFISTLKSIV